MNRFSVNKAVERSDLPSIARHIMLTLSECANTHTCEIAPKHLPNLLELKERTGYGRATIWRHLRLLESSGWLTRDVDAEGATWYRIMIGSSGEQYRAALKDVSEGNTPPPGDAFPSETNMFHSETSTSPSETPHLSITTIDNLNLKNVVADAPPSPSSNGHSPSTALAVAEADLRLDVVRLCDHLADLIEQNGSKRPEIGKTWRDAARLMLDRDGRTEQQVHRAIVWCQADEFWRANVLSMPTLRRQYERLRLQAQRANGQQQPTTTRKVAAGLALVEKYEREEGAQHDQI